MAELCLLAGDQIIFVFRRFSCGLIKLSINYLFFPIWILQKYKLCRMTKESIKISSEGKAETCAKQETELDSEIRSRKDTKDDPKVTSKKDPLANIESLLSSLTLDNYDYDSKISLEEVESNLKNLILNVSQDEDEDSSNGIVTQADTEVDCVPPNSENGPSDERKKKKEKSESRQVESERKLVSIIKDESNNDNDSNLKQDHDILELKTALSDVSGEVSDEDDIPDHILMTRGPVNYHKNINNRFSNLGLYSQHKQENLFTQGFYNSSSFNDSTDASSFDTKLQSYVGNATGQLSPKSVYSSDSSPYYSDNFASFNQTKFGLQIELSNDDWNQTPTSQLHDSPSSEYQPLSPTQSISPFPKEIQDNNQFGIVQESEKDDDDLINIIDTLSDSSKTQIPEFELLNLRNVLEGSENTIRDEMGIYLKNEDPYFQATFTGEEQSALSNKIDDYPPIINGPLTPPQSVSPIQEHCGDSVFTAGLDEQNNYKPNENNFDELVDDILHSITDINPDELNVYLKDERNAYDSTYARNILYDRCEQIKHNKVLRKLSGVSDDQLCHKDDDGDTCLMIVTSKPEDSPCYYENVFCLQEKVMRIKLCCDTPLGRAKQCSLCGNSDPTKFYTLLSHKNREGDTVLSCAIKTNHSDLVVDYILYGILQCEEDFRRVFDDNGKVVLREIAYNYPYLKRYL